MEVIEAIKTELANYIGSKLPSDINILNDFPMPGKKLIYPTLSIFGGEPTFEFKPSRLFNYTEKLGTSATVDSLYEIADIILPIQLDLWCMSKIQRRINIDVCMASLFPEPDIRADLNLQISMYHNVHANFELTEPVRFQETGPEGMISDYRATINLKCISSYLVTKKDFKFLHLYVHTLVEGENESDDIQVF